MLHGSDCGDTNNCTNNLCPGSHFRLRDHDLGSAVITGMTLPISFGDELTFPVAALGDPPSFGIDQARHRMTLRRSRISPMHLPNPSSERW